MSRRRRMRSGPRRGEEERMVRRPACPQFLKF
jgi:hypothetical protein